MNISHNTELDVVADFDYPFADCFQSKVTQEKMEKDKLERERIEMWHRDRVLLFKEAFSPIGSEDSLILYKALLYFEKNNGISYVPYIICNGESDNEVRNFCRFLIHQRKLNPLDVAQFLDDFDSYVALSYVGRGDEQQIKLLDDFEIWLKVENEKEYLDFITPQSSGIKTKNTLTKI